MKKRADGRYQLSVMVGYNDDGTPKRKLVYGKTQKEVKEKAADLRVKHNMGLAINNDITLGEWAMTWLEAYKTGVEYNTKKMYSDIVRKYIVMPIGNLKLKDVKTAHLQKIVNDNSDKGRTVKIFSQTANQIFNQAVMNDLIYKNPAPGVRLPSVAHKPTKRALTEGEMQKITSLSMDKKLKCLIFLLLYTGMRKAEALALSKDDIDWDRNIINVNKSLVFKVNQSEVKTTKTKAGVREVPLLAPLKPVLREYISELKSELLFTCTDGNSISDTAYRHLFGKFVKAMGF